MPKQNITFLGFNINSRDMKISLIKKRGIMAFLSDLMKHSKANHKVYSPDYRNPNIHPTFQHSNIPNIWKKIK